MKKLFLIFLLILLVGCGKDNTSTDSVCGTNRTWATLSPATVVISVGDKSLTKAQTEKIADFMASLFSFVNPTVSEDYKKKFSESRLPKIIGSFANKCLLLGEAVRAGIEPTVVDYEAVASEYRIMMGGISTNKYIAFISRLNNDNRLVYEQELKDSATINAYWRIKYPSLYHVSEKDIRDVQAEVSEMRQKAKKLTLASWDKARKALSRIAEEDFEVVADEMSALKRDEDTLWGKISPRELEAIYPEIAKELSKMVSGQHTDIMELEDGLHIVKLFKREGSGAVSVINNDPEMLTIGQIVIQLPYEYRMAPVEQVVNETRRLRLSTEKKKLIHRLRTAARIEFPAGTNFWPKSEAKMQKRPSKR